MPKYSGTSKTNVGSRWRAKVRPPSRNTRRGVTFIGPTPESRRRASINSSLIIRKLKEFLASDFNVVLNRDGGIPISNAIANAYGNTRINKKLHESQCKYDMTVTGLNFILLRIGHYRGWNAVGLAASPNTMRVLLGTPNVVSNIDVQRKRITTHLSLDVGTAVISPENIMRTPPVYSNEYLGGEDTQFFPVNGTHDKDFFRNGLFNNNLRERRYSLVAMVVGSNELKNIGDMVDASGVWPKSVGGRKIFSTGDFYNKIFHFQKDEVEFYGLPTANYGHHECVNRVFLRGRQGVMFRNDRYSETGSVDYWGSISGNARMRSIRCGNQPDRCFENESYA